jgi:hypothetical protein
VSQLATVEIEQDLLDAASEKAAQQGMSAGAFISLLLRRNFERVDREDTIIAYDHSSGDHFALAREPNESERDYQDRADHFGRLFGR